MSAGVRPLLITENASLLDDVLRLAAAADVELDVAHAVHLARGSWVPAPLVLVGTDLADEMARFTPPRREGVLVVGEDQNQSRAWQQAVALGAEHVIFLPDAESWLVDRLADAVEGGGTLAEVVSVLGGRGGAGASTLAASLALTATRAGRRALLVDGDPLGGGIDLVLGGEESQGSRWSDFTRTQGRISGSTLHESLPRVDELVVLSRDRDDAGPIPSEAMRSVLAAGRRSSELVVVDLPRYADDAAGEALSVSTRTLLVVPAEVRATVAAARVATLAAAFASDIRVVVRGPSPSGLSAEIVGHSLGLAVAGQMRTESGLSAAMERGEPPGRGGRGPLSDFCAAYLEQILPTRESA